MNTHPTIRGIPELVAIRFGVTVGELLSRRRDRDVARPRQVAMWLSKRVSMASLSEIGRYFDRDHKTVMHGIRRVEALLSSDAELAGVVWDITRRIDPDAAASLRRTMVRRAA